MELSYKVSLLSNLNAFVFEQDIFLFHGKFAILFPLLLVSREWFVGFFKSYFEIALWLEYVIKSVALTNIVLL